MAEVTMMVNGTEVTLDVEPRLTLVDALRHRLGLTGSHVGCEHGVCGACTVLIDGAAARSCLMYTVQAAGSEVMTVEALGEVDDLHPLQEAFRRHHGLQCGFCTPGFLMSAYDLLQHGGVDDAQLREELSGVLCRCTGYAGIVAAVREVAQAHPGGLPGPKALGRPIHVRGGGVPAGEQAALHSALQAPPAPTNGGVELSVPEGEPNETVDVSTEIAASPDETWELLQDFPAMSRCLPGVDLGRELAQDTYAGAVKVHLGPMRLSFAGSAKVLERDGPARSLRAIAAGRDASGSGVRADFTVSAGPTDGGRTVVRARAKLYMTGRAAQFGRSLAGDVSRQLFGQFGDCVERTLRVGGTAAPRRLAGGALAWTLLRSRISEFRRRHRRD